MQFYNIHVVLPNLRSLDDRFYGTFVLSMSCVCHAFAALWSPAGKGLTSWLSFMMLSCVLSLSGQVWYLIVSIPDLCHLSYFKEPSLHRIGGNRNR